MTSSCPTTTTTTQLRAERRPLLLAAIALWAIAAASAADPPCEDQEDSDSRDLRGGDSCAHIAAVGGCSHPEYGPQLREQCKKSCNSCQLCPETVNKTTITVNKTTITVANTASAPTSADVNLIPGVSGALPNVDYTSGLQSGTYVDPANPTPTEIQAVIDSVNVAINEDGTINAGLHHSTGDDDDDGAGSFNPFSKRPWEALRKAIERDIAAIKARPRRCSYDHQCDTNYYCHKTVSMFKSSTDSKTGSCKKSSSLDIYGDSNLKLNKDNAALNINSRGLLEYRAHCSEDSDCHSGRCRSGYMGGPNDSKKKQKICVCNTAGILPPNPTKFTVPIVVNFRGMCPPGAYRCGGTHETVCVGHRPVDRAECGEADGDSSFTVYTERHVHGFLKGYGYDYQCTKMCPYARDCPP